MEFFKENIKLLYQKNPTLADYIQALEIPENITVVRSQSGHPTLKVVDSSGKGRYLHSPVDPVSEAGRLLENHSFNGDDGTILFGFGLGYLAAEIARQKTPGHILYVAEGVPALFKLAAMHTDLAYLLTDDQTFLFIGDSIRQITEHFRPISFKTFTGNIHKLAIPSLKALCAEAYDESDRSISEHVMSLRIGQSTFDGNRHLYLSNPMENISALADSSSINHLKDFIKGRPALVFAAGPSLTNHLEVLRRTDHGALMIACDTALKPLLEHGITPDLTATCDPLPMNANKVDGLSGETLTSIPLIYHPDASPKLVERFENTKFVADSHNLLSGWLVRMGHDAVSFPYYHSVSHLAFMLARFMGADPIILAGLDLSFPVDKAHADGVGKVWDMDFENYNFIPVPSNSGGMVKTIPVFVNDIKVMEKEVLNTPARCINCSKNGAMIKGMERMPMEETLNLYGKAGKMSHGLPYRKRISKIFHADPTEMKRKYEDGLKWLISEAEDIARICEAANPLKHLKNRKVFSKNHEACNRVELRTLYESAYKHLKFLTVLNDFISRYHIALAKSPTEGVKTGDLRYRHASDEAVDIFFEELDSFLPDLLRHARKSLTELQQKSLFKSTQT